jgi:hypothetical protein
VTRHLYQGLIEPEGLPADARTVERKQENTLADFKRRIATCLNAAGHAWFEATRVLEAAEKVLSPGDFSSQREQFKWSYSTVRKFIKIARDPFLQRHEAKLGCVESWSVLHEITKLDDAGRELFEAEYLSGRAARYVTRRQVQECRSVKPKQENHVLVLATIKADAKLSEADLDGLSAELWNIERHLSQKFPAVRMVLSKSLVYRDTGIDLETEKAAGLEARH